jgi:multiple sugar transport system permease protein
MAETESYPQPGAGRGRSLIYHAILCVASIAMLYPLLWMLASSFKPESDIFGSAALWPRSFSLDAYWRGWSGLQVSFGKFFLNSLLVSSCCVIGNVASCSLTAYAFARLKFRGQNFWFALMLGTLMLPYHVTLIPQYILFLNLGWVDTFLPLIVPKFLAADAFFIFLLVQFFRSIPRELDEACRCRCRRSLPPRSSPSSGPGMTSSGRSSISMI